MSPSAGFWKYPEAAENPSITRVVNSTVSGSTAPLVVAIDIRRHTRIRYVNPASKLLKIDIVGSIVQNNVQTRAADPALGVVGGVALTSTDEAAANRPTFNRAAYVAALTTAWA